MAKPAKCVFFECPETVREAACFSTQGNPQNAVALLSRLQPSYAVYTSDTAVCTLNGFLRIPLEVLEKIDSRHSSSIRFHCAEDETVKFKVPLEETLLLQTEVLFSCGPEFAQQYATDCYMHHLKNGFVRKLYQNVMERILMFPRWRHLQEQGQNHVRYAMHVCANTILKFPAAKSQLQSALEITEMQCNHNHNLFMCIWDSTQKSLGIQHVVVQDRHYRRKPSKYTPKSLTYREELRLYHPDDFDRILIFTLMHKGWINKTNYVRPSKFIPFWDALHV